MLIAYTVIWNVICMFLLKYLMKHSFKEFSKKEIIYFAVMICANIFLAGILMEVYQGNGFIHNAKRVTLVSLLWAIAPIDYREYRIPNDAILTGLAMWVLFIVGELIFDNDVVFSNIVSEIIIVLVVVVFTVICSVVMKGSIGAGDIKLLMLMGAFQGIDGAVGSIMASLIFLFISAVVLLAMHKKGRKDTLPFAPCALAGTFLSVILTGM